MNTTEHDILNNLLPALAERSVPPDAFLPTLQFRGFPSIYNIVEKHATLTCLNLTFVDTIVEIIRHTLEASYAYRTDTIPPPPTPADIDLTPLTSAPRYCQITSCTFHNNKRDIYPDTLHGIDAAEAHGIHLHRDLFTTLNTSQLLSIGWHRCCDLCPNIYITQESATIHRDRCITFITSTSHTHDTTAIGPFHHLRTGRFASLYLVCPPDHVRDLDKLILDYPEEDPVTLFAVVHGWHTASQSIRDNNSTATTETVNER